MNGVKPAAAPTMLSSQSYSLPSTPVPFALSSANPLSTFPARNRGVKGSSSTLSFPPPPQNTNPVISPSISFNEAATKPQFNISSPPLFPVQPTPPPQQPQQRPNYNIQLAPANLPTFSTPTLPFNSILAPSAPAKPTWGSGTSGQKQGKDAWGDFDPLA